MGHIPHRLIISPPAARVDPLSLPSHKIIIPPSHSLISPPRLHAHPSLVYHHKFPQNTRQINVCSLSSDLIKSRGNKEDILKELRKGYTASNLISD